MIVPLFIILLSLRPICAVKIGVSRSTTAAPTNSPNTTMSTIVTEVSTTSTTVEIATTVPSTEATKPTLRTNTPSITKATTITAKPTTTTEVADVVADSGTAVQASARTTDPKVDHYCYCNLLLNTCDVNCCCDADCSKDALKVFNCYAEPSYREWHNRLEDFKYEHGLPSCSMNDGWLCVFRTNTKPEEQKIPNPNTDTASYYKWPNLLLEVSEEEALTESFYKVGEPLKLINLDTLELQNFELPQTFIPPYCQLEEPIRHLKSTKRSCLTASLEDLQANKRKLLHLAATTRLLVTPNLQVENLPEIQVQRCLKIEQTYQCGSLNANYNTTDFEMDNFYATEIIIKILHNYTNIIEGVLELREQEINTIVATAAEEETDLYLWQDFEIQFIPAISGKPGNGFDLYASPPTAKTASGPLGYLQGEPVIVANFIANNPAHDISQFNRVLSYFHENTPNSLSNYTVSLFTKRQGVCHKNGQKENLINYGINTLKQCKVRLSNETFSFDSAGVQETCGKLQRAALMQLFDADFGLEKMSEMFVSQLGKPQNASDKWLPLEVKNYDTATVVGHFNVHTQSFTCRNILLNIAYEFRVGTFVEQGVPHQALIKHAALILKDRHDLEFTLDETIEVPLSATVMFYDMNTNVISASEALHFINISFLLISSVSVLSSLFFGKYLILQ